MSWNKNTISASSIEATAKALHAVDVEYTLEVIGDTDGFGLNDQEDKKYHLKQLSFFDKRGVKNVHRDQMQRTHECDSDDRIVTLDVTGKSAEEIELIPTVIIWHEADFCDNHTEMCPVYDL